MMLKALALCALAGVASVAAEYQWANPKVTKPEAGKVIKAGDSVTVEWGESNIGGVNIEIYCPQENASSFPIFLGTAQAASRRYQWKVPESFVASQNCRFLVWGAVQPGRDGGDGGVSPIFTIANESEQAVPLFTVFTPAENKELEKEKGSEGGCYWGKECKITWGYNELDLQRPDTVNISVYTPESPFPLFTIAQSVPASERQYTWQVPEIDGEYASLIANRKIYVSVSGSGVPMAHADVQSHMGASSKAFEVEEYVAPEVAIEEPKVEKVDIDSGKLKNLTTNGASAAAAGSALVFAAVAAAALL